MRKRIPYDRVNMGEEEMLGGPVGAGDLLGPGADMGAMPVPPNPGGMAGPDLAALGGGGAPTDVPPIDAAAGGAVTPPVPDDSAFEEMALQELMAALNDPATPPEEREMIQAQLQEAARRRLAGV